MTDDRRKQIIEEIKAGKSLGEYDEEVRKDIEIAFEAVLANDNNGDYVDPSIIEQYETDPAPIIKKISKNKDLIKRIIAVDKDVVEFLDEDLKKDHEIQDAMLKASPSNIQYASEGKKKDIDLARELVSRKGDVIQYFSEDIKNNEEIALLSLDSAYNYRYIGDELKKNKDFLSRVIDRNQSCYDLFGEMKNDKDLTLKAISINSGNFDYIPEELANDKDFIKKILEIDSNIYKKISEAMRSDKNIASRAIEMYKENARYISGQLIGDLEFIKSIVERDPQTFGFLPASLKNNNDIIFFACKKDINNIKYIDDQNIKQIMEDINNDSSKYNNIPAELREAKDFLGMLININPNVFKYIAESMRKDKEICLKAVLLKVDNINYIDSDLKNDVDFAKQVVGKWPNCYGEFSEEIRNDREFAIKVIDEDQRQIQFMGNNLQDDLELARELISKYPNSYKYFNDNVKSNQELAITAISQNRDNAVYLGSELKVSFGFASKVISQMPELYRYFDDSLKKDPKILATFLENGAKDLTTNTLRADRRSIQFEKDTITELADMIDTSEVDKEALRDKNDCYLVSLYQKQDEELNKYIKELLNERISEKVPQGEMSRIDPKDIDSYVENLLRNNLSVFYIPNKLSKKSLMYMSRIGNIRNDGDNDYVNTMLDETIEKTNRGHIDQLRGLLETDEYKGASLELVHKMYETIGFERSSHLLTGKYGRISRDNLYNIFKDVNNRDVIFEPDGKRFKPVLNEDFINTFFGQNYKIDDTPIKRYLGSNKVRYDLNPEERQTEEKQNKNARTMFSKFSKILSEWDIIEEEYIRMESKSKLKLKKNPEVINKLVDCVESTRGVRVTEQDEKLLNTDIMNYISDTQYVDSTYKAPFQRALELSRNQEKCNSKKFPKVDLEDERAKVTVFHPQDREILTMGYKSGCCLRPCGNADNSGKDDTSLLAYCTSSEYAGGIKIENSTGGLLMFSPLIRSGNMLMIHSIETLGMNNEELELVHENLVKWSEKVIEESSKVEGKDGIRAVAITDLHHLDKRYTKGTLTTRRFEVYDNGEFNGYSNLDNAHEIIAIEEGYTEKDLYCGRVDYTYEYPNNDITHDSRFASVNPENIGELKRLDELKSEISVLSNSRKQCMDAHDEIGARKIYEHILKTKIEYLEKFRVFVKEKESYDKIKDAIENVDKKVGDMEEVSEIPPKCIYASEWYLGIYPDNTIIYKSTENGEEILKEYIDRQEKLAGVNFTKKETVKETMPKRNDFDENERF